MPKTFKGLSQSVQNGINEMGYDKYMETGLDAHYNLNLGHFFDEDDFSAILDTPALGIFGGNLNRYNDIPLSTTILYCMGKYGKTYSDLEQMDKKDLRKMGHEMLQDLQQNPITKDGADKNFQNFFKTILDGTDRFLDEPFPNTNFRDLNSATLPEMKKIHSLAGIMMALSANIFPDLGNIPNSDLLVRSAGLERVNELSADCDKAHLKLGGLDQSIFMQTGLNSETYAIQSGRRKLLQEHADTYEIYAQGSLRESNNYLEDQYIGAMITSSVAEELGIFSDENHLDLENLDRVTINDEYPNFIMQMDLEPIASFHYNEAENIQAIEAVAASGEQKIAEHILADKGINHSTYGDLLENHRFEFVFDEHGLPHSMDYLETLDANQKFYMAPQGEIQEFELVENSDGQVVVHQTDADPKKVQFKDMRQIRSTIDDMAKALKDADPKTLLTGSKEFKQIRESMADLQKSVQDPDFPIGKLSEKLQDTLQKAGSYINYRTRGEGKNKNMSDIAKTRISAVTACANGLKSMLDMGISFKSVKDISNETMALSHTAQYVMDARVKNGDSAAQMVLDSIDHMKALTVMSPKQRNEALKGMFITQKQKVQYGKSLSPEQRQTDPRLGKPTLADEIAFITTARLFERKFPNAGKNLDENAFSKVLNDKETRRMISNFIGTKFQSDIQKGNFSSIIDLMTDEKSMDKLLVDAMDMKKNPMVAQTNTRTMEKTNELSPGVLESNQFTL